MLENVAWSTADAVVDMVAGDCDAAADGYGLMIMVVVVVVMVVTIQGTLSPGFCSYLDSPC